MLKKILFSFAISFFALMPFANHANAATGVAQLKSNLSVFGSNTGLGSDADLKTKVASIINIVLGFLGILATIMIIYAGFKWITAAGNEETVTDAKGTIRNAVIGIAVIMLSFVIVNFAVSQFSDATGAGGGDGGGAGDGGQVVSPDGTCIYYKNVVPIIGPCNAKVECITEAQCMAKNSCDAKSWSNDECPASGICQKGSQCSIISRQECADRGFDWTFSTGDSCP